MLDVKTILDYAPAITWPVALIVLTLIFRTPISSFINYRINKKNGNGNNVVEQIIAKLESNHLHDVVRRDDLRNAMADIKKELDSEMNGVRADIRDLRKHIGETKSQVDVLEGRLNTWRQG